MRKTFVTGAVGALLFAVAAPAFAHVTMKPNEALAGGFSTFVVSVPTERDDASTIKVDVQFPPLAFVSFEDVPGWERTVKTGKFDEPVEAFGDTIKEGVLSVTWSGGEIGPGEFQTFPVSIGPVPDGLMEFPAIQTYDNGEVVRWVGPSDADEPAPLVKGITVEGHEEDGELTILADTHEDLDGLEEEVAAGGGEPAEEPTDAAAPDDAGDTEDDSEETDLISYIGLGLGAVALIVALIALSRKKTA